MSDLPPPSARRHDLDALRSFAMLLGIGLHAALAYIGFGWIVNDGQTSTGLRWMLNAVHGFRMPLFFLLSGFFTAMLWKKRGIGGLLKHRFQRIALPLILACSIITPTMWSVINWASSREANLIQASAEIERNPGERAPSPDIWTVASYGDLEGLAAYGSDSDQLNVPDPMYGVTPLGWTAIRDQPAAAKYLLDAGADPNARYRDQNTPLHTACFFGRAKLAGYLLEAGADVTIQSGVGERPADSMAHNQQITESIASMLQLPLDFESVKVGRDRIREMIADQETAAANPVEASQPFLSMIQRLQDWPLFHHLWFLWFLCWLIAGFAAVTSVLEFLPKIRLPAMLFSVPLCFVWLVPLTMLTQSQMHSGGTVPGFGPDTSIGLIPVPHVLLHYAIFFGFGAMIFAHHGADKKLGTHWFVTLPLAFVVLPFGLIFAYDTQRSTELIANETLRLFVMHLMQVLYAWLMTFGLLGLFETVLNKERYWVRYLSDSSYWLYLVHLPLIIAGQALLLSVDLPAIAKFALLAGIGTTILLATYALFVRYTPIGTLLNGKRARIQRAGSEPLRT